MNSPLFFQSFDKTTLLFSDWLDENIQDERKTKNIRRNGSTVYLKEQKTEFSMNVKIENVDQGLSIINFEQMGKVTTYFKGRGKAKGEERQKGFNNRCDFLVLEETDDEYIAYLIELKNKVPDQHAASQLRWSAPYLKYILEVYLEHSLMECPEKKLNVKFFMVGTNYSGLVNRGGMKRQTARIFEKWDVGTRLDMYYRIYTAGHRFEFSEFREVAHA